MNFIQNNLFYMYINYCQKYKKANQPGGGSSGCGPIICNSCKYNFPLEKCDCKYCHKLLICNGCKWKGTITIIGPKETKMVLH